MTSKFIKTFELTRTTKPSAVTTTLIIEATRTIGGWRYRTRVELVTEDGMGQGETSPVIFRSEADAFQWGQDRIAEWVK